jgi:hypothetical protein
MSRAGFLARVRHWQQRLGLSAWTITVQTVTLPHRADCDAKPEYKEALLRFDLKKIPQEEVEAYIVHELMHCHVWRLAKVGEYLAKTPTEKMAVEEAEESLTTELERIILSLVREGMG